VRSDFGPSIDRSTLHFLAKNLRLAAKLNGKQASYPVDNVLHKRPLGKRTLQAVHFDCTMGCVFVSNVRTVYDSAVK
jgi:hypothetical protein